MACVEELICSHGVAPSSVIHARGRHAMTADQLRDTLSLTKKIGIMDYLLWTPAQRKRASMLYFANVLFIYLFFYGRLILRPW